MVTVEVFAGEFIGNEDNGDVGLFVVDGVVLILIEISVTYI